MRRRKELRRLQLRFPYLAQDTTFYSLKIINNRDKRERRTMVLLRDVTTKTVRDLQHQSGHRRLFTDYSTFIQLIVRYKLQPSLTVNLFFRLNTLRCILPACRKTTSPFQYCSSSGTSSHTAATMLPPAWRACVDRRKLATPEVRRSWLSRS